MAGTVGDGGREADLGGGMRRGGKGGGGERESRIEKYFGVQVFSMVMEGGKVHTTEGNICCSERIIFFEHTYSLAW